MSDKAIDIPAETEESQQEYVVVDGQIHVVVATPLHVVFFLEPLAGVKALDMRPAHRRMPLLRRRATELSAKVTPVLIAHAAKAGELTRGLFNVQTQEIQGESGAVPNGAISFLHRLCPRLSWSTWDSWRPTEAAPEGTEVATEVVTEVATSINEPTP